MLHIQKLNTYQTCSTPCSNLGWFEGTLGTSRNYSRVVHLGCEVHLGSQMSGKLQCQKGSRPHKSQTPIKHAQPPRSNPGRFGGTLGTSRNYSRVVHLGCEVHLGSQMSAEITMPKRAPTTQKSNTYQTCSTPSQ